MEIASTHSPISHRRLAEPHRSLLSSCVKIRSRCERFSQNNQSVHYQDISRTHTKIINYTININQRNKACFVIKPNINSPPQLWVTTVSPHNPGQSPPPPPPPTPPPPPHHQSHNHPRPTSSNEGQILPTTRPTSWKSFLLLCISHLWYSWPMWRYPLPWARIHQQVLIYLPPSTPPLWQRHKITRHHRTSQQQQKFFQHVSIHLVL